MALVTAHYLYFDDDPQEAYLATVVPAKEDDVDRVINADPTSPDGRSNWVWIRLQNGDLILGTFPQGATYETVEDADQVGM